MLPAIAGGWVQVWALDPKRMELSFGRALFTRYADQAAAMVELLEAAVAEMHNRAAQFAGRTRTFTSSTAFPFLVVLVDELAFLTAYQPDRDLRKRAEAAIATLTSQGPSVGVWVVGAPQDPRKDVISLRNLFPTRVALRLDESDQVDMVLGDGARDRGALADLISPLPQTGSGVGYVRLEASPDPVRVRAAYVTDGDNAGRRKGTRAERLSMPLARDVVKELAVGHGACIRPVQLRRTDLATGQTEPVLVPCGHTLASVCPSCAERAKNLRAAQCREGWHLEREPVIEPNDPNDEQLWWIEKRADAQAFSRESG